MIDYEKFDFWISCQLDDIKEAYMKEPTQYLYGAMKAYEATIAQLKLVWGSCND